MDKRDFFHLLAMLTPIVVAAIPGGAAVAPFVGAAMHEAELIPGGTGEQKKAHAMSVVLDSVAAVNLSAGHQAIDPQLAAATADEAIDTTIAAVKLVQSRSAASSVAKP